MSPGDSRTFPLPLPHSHVVDPRVLLQELHLSPALLQGRAQLLHVAAAVVEGDVAPVPDPAEEEELWVRLKDTLLPSRPGTSVQMQTLPLRIYFMRQITGVH